MATNTILKRLEQPKAFQAFIEDNMKVSTYKPLWRQEISQIDYEPAKVYQATVAEYAAAVVGSVIDKNGEKPVHNMPTIGELVGSIGHMGDEWELDNDYLDRMAYLEGRYRSRVANYTQAQNQEQYDKLIGYAFRPFEKAVIAPQKRLDMLYFEGLFNGTQTVSRNNNTKSNVSYTFSIGIKTFGCTKGTAVWGEANSTPFDDIQAVVDYAASKGRTVQKIRMSKATFRKMCKSTQVKSAFRVIVNGAQVQPAAIVSPAQVNAYLQSILLPTIVVEPDRYATLANGASVNLTPDDRVAFQCAPTIAVMKIADPLELVDPLDGKVYSQHDDNLVGYWRDKTGRHTDYDMWGQPVFTGKNNYFILTTDKVQE